MAKRATISRREEILSTAAMLFGRQGYHQTTMQQIADEVGILKGSLYHHYRSKQEILFEVTRGPLGELVDEVRLTVESDAEIPQKIEHAIRAHIFALSRAYPHLMVVTAETDEALPDGIRENILSLRRQYQRLWQKMISAGLADGSIVSTGSAAALVNLILGSINWMHRWYTPAGKLGPDQLASVLSDLVLHGIVPAADTKKRRVRQPARQQQ
jgi:AcrR family transcriptional regulator